MFDITRFYAGGSIITNPTPEQDAAEAIRSAEYARIYTEIAASFDYASQSGMNGPFTAVKYPELAKHHPEVRYTEDIAAFARHVLNKTFGPPTISVKPIAAQPVHAPKAPRFSLDAYRRTAEPVRASALDRIAELAAAVRAA